jgi:hypothetical protein
VKLGKSVVARSTAGRRHGRRRAAANALVAAHGGLYRTVDGPQGPAVLGRGEGYAIAPTVRVEQLESAVRLLAATKPAKR